MAAVDEVGAPSSLESSNSSNFSGAALLLIVGEPFSEDHKELILERVAKGLRCWEVDCDLNAELQAVAAAAPVGEEGPNGEKVAQHISDNLKIEIVVSGTHQTVCNKIRSLLLTPAKQRHLVYAGYAFQGSGDWVLQDDCLTFATFASVFKEAEVENVLRQQEGSSLSLYTFPEGEWSSNSLAKHPVSKLLKISVNPEEKLAELAGVVQLGGYLSYLLKVQTVMELHKASDVVGNIRFSRPTLYIFPGCQGDSSLFGISGFNLLVNGGYSRKACFWDFTRHLDRIDAVLLTHLGADNLFGISSVLQRKAVENAHPEIGHMYFNCLDKQTKHSPNGDSHPENGGAHKPASLLINLVEEGNSIIENLRNLGQSPHPCTGHVVNHGLQPLNLYHKVGHGTLDMYILNPVQDSKEVKDFLSQWNKHVSNFSSAKSQFKVNNKEMSIPLTNMMSIAALLVWRPSAANESITRILFPGSAPQNRLFEGLDKLKGLDIFQHPCCSESSLHAPKGAKKPPAGKGRAPPKSTPPPAAPSPIKAEPRKEAVPKLAKATSPAKPSKEAKNTKKMAAGKEDKTEKSPATTPSDTKSPTPAESPKITLTPSNTPAEVSSPEKTDTLSSDVASSHEEAVTPLKEEAVSPAVELPPEPEQPKEPEPAEPELLIPEPAAPAPVQQEVPEPVEAWPEASAQQSLPESQQDITPTETSPGEMPPGLSDPLIPGFGGDAQPPNLMDTAPEADRPAPPIETPEALPEPAVVTEEPAAPVAMQPEEKLPEPAENVDLLQSEPRQPDLIADTDQQSQPASQQQLEELGIYDGDEKDVDTTEVVTPPSGSQPTLEELGIYDDQEKDAGQPEQPESEQPAPEQLPPSDAPEADLPAAGGAKTEEAKAPAEPDLGVFDGAAPEGLPSPQEPGLEVSPPVVEADLLEKTPGVTEESCPVVDDTPAPEPQREEESEPQKEEESEPQREEESEPQKEEESEPQKEEESEPQKEEESEPQREDPEASFKPEMLPDVPGDNGLAEIGTAEEPESFRPETLPDVSEVTGLSEVGASEEPESLRAETLPDVSEGGLEEPESVRPVESEPQAPEETLEVSQSPDVASDPLSSPATETEPTETESQLPSDLSPPPPAEPEAPCDAQPQTPPAEVAPVAGVDNSPFEIIDAPTDAPAEEGAANPQTNPFIMGSAEGDVQPGQEEFDLQAESHNIPSHNGPVVDDAPAQNPFEIPADASPAPVSAEGQEIDRDSLEREAGGLAEGEGDFDPLQSWGQPMGLPAPSPKKPAGGEGAAAKDPKAAASKNGPAKPKPPGGSAAGAKKAPASTAKKTAGGPASATSKPRSGPAKKESPTTRREPVKKEEPKKNGAKDAPTKRPAASSAAGARKPAGRPAPAKSEPASKTTGRKTASASGAKTAPAAKPLGPVTPCYLDLTYIPHHGDMSYIDMDFFRRVRAKYYVLSALNPSPQVLNALLEAKETWDNPDLEVTIIPTHDTPTLHHWMGLHREQLSQNKIVVAPSANRCTIQLQDQEASCSAYRLEF